MLSTATPRVRKRPNSIKTLWIYLVLVQKSFELIRVEIRQDPVTRNERGHIRLGGTSFHVLVRPAIFSDIDLLEAIAFLAQIILRVNAPRTPLAAGKRQFHRQCGINEWRLRSQLRCTDGTSRRNQYDFAQSTRRALDSPVKIHFPGSDASSSGITRIVTFRSFLICSSTSREPLQCASAKPPWISGFAEFFAVKKS